MARPKLYFDAKTSEDRERGQIRLDPRKAEAKGAFRVGYFTSFTGTVKGRGPVFVGKYCAIGDDCRLIAGSHDTQMFNLQIRLQRDIGAAGGHHRKGPIRVGHNVWFGDSVMVMSGVTIGNGAICASGSVITSDVPDFAIVGGLPARFLRWRFTESVRQQLNDLAWWDWPRDRIERNKAFFEYRLEADEVVDLSTLVVD